MGKGWFPRRTAGCCPINGVLPHTRLLRRRYVGRKNPHLFRVNSAITPRLWHPASLYRLNPFRRALLYLLHPFSRPLFSPNLPCHTVATIFQQAASFVANSAVLERLPPGYFNTLLKRIGEAGFIFHITVVINNGRSCCQILRRLAIVAETISKINSQMVGDFTA